MKTDSLVKQENSKCFYIIINRIKLFWTIFSHKNQNVNFLCFLMVITNFSNIKSEIVRLWKIEKCNEVNLEIMTPKTLGSEMTPKPWNQK